jgi:hypothetical protein
LPPSLNSKACPYFATKNAGKNAVVKPQNFLKRMQGVLPPFD